MIVFTNGVFDILHKGHIYCLEQAAKHGQLIVGVNSDASATRVKRKPVNDEVSRLAVIRALKCVSLAVMFDEDKPARLIAELKPDLYVKGGDYNIDELASYGIEVLLIPRMGVYSTTSAIQRARESRIPG